MGLPSTASSPDVSRSPLPFLWPVLGLSARFACSQPIYSLRGASSCIDLPAVTGGFRSPPSLRSSAQPPQPTGPWLRTSCVVPFLLTTPTRSASLADSRRFPRITGYTAGLCPTPCSELQARPSLLWVRAPSLRAVTPTPRGGARNPSLPSLPIPPQNMESAPLFPLTSAPVRALLTTLQCSLHATARKVAGPPGLVRPRALLWPPRTFTSELARGQSPGPRVGYHYTAFLEENCGRTSTGWSTTVTGCTFRRKVYDLYHILKRSNVKNATNCREQTVMIDFATVPTVRMFRPPAAYGRAH